MTVTLSGTYTNITQERKKYVRQNKSVKDLHYHPVRWSSENDSYVVIVIKVTPYTPEEQQEIDVYGDPDHEAYLSSEDYEYDSKHEPYAWLLNE